jgi:uncharacterized membrane protein
MWRNKKFVIVAVVAAVLLVGSIAGVAFAQTGTGDASQPAAQSGTLLDKVCAIYEQNTGTAINADELTKAFTQARSEMQDEALDNYLKNLVDQGKLTQEQADQYKAWLKSKPDVPLAPGFPGHGMHRGGGGLPGWCEPPQPTE